MSLALLFAAALLAAPVAIDGDTLRDGSERYRIANLDAPELSPRARCGAEAELALRARAAAERMLAQARRVTAEPVGRRDVYGRVVAYVQVDGADLGEALIEAGLARPWRGRASDFCR